MKELKKFHTCVISGGVNLASVLYIGTLSTMAFITGYYLAKNTKVATKEEEEYYSLAQNMQAFNQPQHSANNMLFNSYNDLFGI